MTRRQSREQAFVLMFEKSFRSDEKMEDIISAALESEMLKEDEFSFLISNTAEENLDKIDEQILKYCRGWSLSRIPKVSLAIMRVAVAEMLFIESVPVNVSISEAVEISKIYGEKNDSSFINGILSSISKEIKNV
ncbi:MAG: transcription antitermination factor NusB [Clostridia bacterium]|nr:transcription antitermination factor NusB [Clostridia bacterium]